MAKLTKKQQSAIEEEIANACIAIVDRERTNWEEAIVYVTEKVAFRMRELIRILRKNYWGVFDEPIDKSTGREKVWIGLAMSLVETWTKNIDLDSKDIGFIARVPEGSPITEITRIATKDYLDRMYFGEILDTDQRQVLIDGTLVWKTWEDKSSGKVVMKRKTVDLLNCYIDPTEDSIQSAYRFTERSLVLPEQLASMTGWKNTKDLKGSQTLNKIDGNRRSNFGTQTTGEFRDVWECWGKIPKWLINGDKKADDAYEEIDGHIVISGLEAVQPTLHLVEENTRKDKFGNSLKPYEEWRVSKLSNRWYGLGIVERILNLQEYLNTLVNIRINRGYVSQLGLFKIKKGKGITPQMLNKLPVNGAIQVQDMGDIEQMNVSEVGQSSYNDEEVIKYWSQQITSAQPIASGEIMPASATATSSAIANTNAKTAFTLFKESTGLFLERWIDRHAMPIIAKTIKKGDIFKIVGDDDKYKELIENVALDLVYKQMNEGDVVPSENELLMAVDKEVENLSRSSQFFVENVQEIIADMLDSKVHITNEDLDSSVTIANLLQLMQIPPENRDDDSVAQIYDLMGLRRPKYKKPEMPTGQEMTQEQMISGTPNQTDIMSNSLLNGQVA